MVAHIHSIAFEGVDVLDVDIQVQIASGLPAFNIVGLPDKAVAESKERVRSSLHSLGLSLPAKRITINLAPADVIKEGSHYDLPIALGLLSAMDVIPSDQLNNALMLGELGLDGKIRSSGGILPAALHAMAMDYSLICAEESGAEARWAGNVEVIAVPDLMSLINHFKGILLIAPMAKPSKADLEDRHAKETQGNGPDLSDIKGQESAKSALIISASGGHNVLMVGPPGSGKSMLAATLPSILPDLSSREALETSIIHSISGVLPNEGLITARPYRAPHHSATLPALIGGGAKAKPGELSLAHNGVLFLDELPEFARNTLESLRQPIETGEVMIARANHHLTYPAKAQLVAAMNPCRCGYLGDGSRECSKAPKCGTDYQSKISGPMLDRFDLHVNVPAVVISDLSLPSTGITSAQAKIKIEMCRALQLQRNQGKTNAQLSTAEIESFIPLSEEVKAFFEKSAQSHNLSARGYHRILRVARSIADLNIVEEFWKDEDLYARHHNQMSSDLVQNFMAAPQTQHHIQQSLNIANLAEALSYRH